MLFSKIVMDSFYFYYSILKSKVFYLPFSIMGNMSFNFGFNVLGNLFYQRKTTSLYGIGHICSWGNTFLPFMPVLYVFPFCHCNTHNLCLCLENNHRFVSEHQKLQSLNICHHSFLLALQYQVAKLWKHYFKHTLLSWLMCSPRLCSSMALL